MTLALNMAPTQRVVTTSNTDLELKLAALIKARSDLAIQEHGQFIIGVSGGSGAKCACNVFVNLDTDWTKWRIFFCDERYVPHDDPECTYKVYKENFVSKVPSFSPDHIYPIKSELSLDKCAQDYAEQLKTVTGITDDRVPQFDMLLLGMGPDGHTCSLFPGHHLLDETSLLVSPISDSPKPPSSRVTLTFPVLNSSLCAVFVATGEGKAEMVRRALEPKESDAPIIPAGRVKLTKGDLIWYLDTGSAKLLTN